MANLLEDLANFLIAGQYAVGIGTDLFLNNRPDQPDNILCLYEYNGTASDLADIGNRRIQCVVRTTSEEVTRVRINAIFKAFREHSAQIEDELIGVRWIKFTPLTTPARLYQDEHQRTLYSFNLSCVTTID